MFNNKEKLWNNSQKIFLRKKFLIRKKKKTGNTKVNYRQLLIFMPIGAARVRCFLP